VDYVNISFISISSSSFPKFILILILVKIGVSSFGHRICPASTPDSSKFFQTWPVIYPDMSGLSAKKNLKLDQNLPFWFISSTHLDVCDHVKILRCLKGEGGMVEEVFIMYYLSIWSWAKLLPITEKRSSNQVILQWIKIMSF
jgi:hypothetical protein